MPGEPPWAADEEPHFEEDAVQAILVECLKTFNELVVTGQELVQRVEALTEKVADISESIDALAAEVGGKGEE